MSQVNLLPPEVRRGQRQRRTTGIILLAGLALLALILGFYLLQVSRLGAVNDDIEAQEQTNAQIQTEIGELQRFADLQSEAQRSQELLSTAYVDEVSLSGLLMDVSSIVPSDSYLSSLTATIDGTDPTGASPIVGTMQFSGFAIGYDTVATWLQRLEQVKGWVNPWVPNVSVDDASIDSQSFTASVDLTTEAITDRGRGAAGVQP